MKTSRYNGGYIRPTRHGSFIAEVNYAYKRHKKTCKNVDDARAWIDGVQIELAKRTRPLDPWDLRDARIARDILPEGVTLADAARFYQAHHRGDPGLTIETVIQRHLDEKHKRRLREKTLTILTQRLRLLQTALGARPVAAVTPDELRAWLDARGLYGRTRNHYRAMLHDLFRFAVLSGYRETNPVAAIATVHIDDTQPGILTVDQTKALLRAAETRDPDCIPYLAIGLFAGIRPAELDRLTWRECGPTEIHVTGAIAKTRRHRYVTIAPNLAAWLNRYRGFDETAVRPVNFRARFRQLRADADADPWPHDALRHSFASYHLAHHRDAALTAHELGHRNPDLLYRHYRALVTPAAAARYWSLTPDPEG